MEDIKHYLSTSTNHNSDFTNSLKNKINNYLNYMDYRGSLKNKKNLNKIKNTPNSEIETEYEKEKDKDTKLYIDIHPKKRKSNSEIFFMHKRILSNILTSKEFIKKSHCKKKISNINKTNSELDKTICDYDNKSHNVIDEESNEEDDVGEEFNCDRCNVNKVKDFQDKYLKGGIKFIKKIDVDGIKLKNEFVEEDNDKVEDEEKDFVGINDDATIKNKNSLKVSDKDNNKRMFNKRLFNLQRNKNFFTFNPNRVSSKLTEEKIISLVKYNLQNKESPAK